MRAFCSRYTFHFNNYLRKLERRPKWQHIRFTYDILSFLWSVQPLRVTPAYTGEKHCACFRRTHSRGSPPRMRGKVPSCGGNSESLGITPAHAGKSLTESRNRSENRDHPRACGEKVFPHLPGELVQGSPPRMRGKGYPFIAFDKPNRITPAHAGKRFRPYQSYIDYKDHPRACGEKPGLCSSLTKFRGSPPRMRGKA